MSNKLKLWKEASTLILISPKNITKNLFCQFDTVNDNKIDKQNTGWPMSKDYDYNVLVLKRSIKSGFFPNSYVFPGGVVENCDFNNDWLPILSKTNNLSSVKVEKGFRPSMFQNTMENSKSLTKDLGLRICAIRELFEETGVLLAKNWNADKIEEINNLESYRKRVNDDPETFLDICKELQISPQIDCLKEWSNWLTPTSIMVNSSGKKRRYDTAFYIAISSEYFISYGKDKREVEHVRWLTPSRIVDEFESGRSFLPPPQVYEFSKLANFVSYEHLEQFSNERQNLGLSRYFPVRINLIDCSIGVLPGDGLYPKEEDLDLSGEKGVICLQETIKENLAKNKGAINRYIVHKKRVDIECDLQSLGFPIIKPRFVDSLSSL